MKLIYSTMKLIIFHNCFITFIQYTAITILFIKYCTVYYIFIKLIDVVLVMTYIIAATDLTYADT